jgi:hypothetical protein
MPTKLTHEIITAAIEGFEAQKTRIDAQIAELRAVLTGGVAAPATTPESPIGKRKRFSAASRRKMALAQKARWAKIRGDSEPPAPKEAPKPKRQISKEGMARIIAATKKRWRLQKAAAKAQSTAAKKAVPARKKAAVKKTAKAPTPAVAQTAAQ